MQLNLIRMHNDGPGRSKLPAHGSAHGRDNKGQGPGGRWYCATEIVLGVARWLSPKMAATSRYRPNHGIN